MHLRLPNPPTLAQALGVVDIMSVMIKASIVNSCREH